MDELSARVLENCMRLVTLNTAALHTAGLLDQSSRANAAAAMKDMALALEKAGDDNQAAHYWAFARTIAAGA